jgi:hypothetical protein
LSMIFLIWEYMPEKEISVICLSRSAVQRDNIGTLMNGGAVMPVTGAFIAPHPPVIIPEIGLGREAQIQRLRTRMMKFPKGLPRFVRILSLLFLHIRLCTRIMSISLREAAHTGISARSVRRVYELKKI